MSSISPAGSLGAQEHNRRGVENLNTRNTTAGKTESTGASVGDDNSIEFSTRAQKIQKLNEEFFPSGYRSVKITPAFIERLHEYGFISAEEANKLSPTAADKQPNGTLEELSRALEDFSDKLREENPENSLIATLQKANSIISNLDGSKPASMVADIKSVIIELERYSYSEQAQSLKSEDKALLRQLETTMQIVAKLNQGSNSSEKINSYLSILDQPR